MIVPGSANPLLLRRSGGGYQINQSLRYRASNSATITRTPGSSGNRRTFTWSGWIKRGNLSNFNYFFGSGATSQTSGAFSIVFQNTAQIQVSIWDGSAAAKTTNAVYRDPTAWYHIVVAVDTTNATAADRVRLYVNGTEVTSFASATNPSLNLDTQMFTSGSEMRFGSVRDSAGAPSFYFDGNFAEFNLISGQVLTPASFGQTDATTNSWVPRRYTGTYGAHDQYLPFNDATSTTTISQDRSGNGNNWTSSGISVTAGVTFDQMTDSPTNNFATLNPIQQGGGTYDCQIPTGGNLNVGGGSGRFRFQATQPFTTGKWYAELTVTATGGGYPVFGVWTGQVTGSDAYPGFLNATGASYEQNGSRSVNGVNTAAWGASIATNDIMSIAVDADTGRVWFGKNGVWQASGDPANGTNAAATLTANSTFIFGGGVSSVGGATASLNFGQRAFDYTPPTGFLALNTANLPTPTIQRGDDAFFVGLRTGTGTADGQTQTITGVRFAPDLLWNKSRSNAFSHNLVDRVRGDNLILFSNTADAEANPGAQLALTSDGFVATQRIANAATNQNGVTYVNWAWREGAAYGFDIVTYTGNGANRTIAHGLNAVPHMMIIKNRSAATDWPVYHRNQNATPQNGSVFLNTTAAYAAGATIFNSTAPTSSEFSVGTASSTNGNTNNLVAYLFTSIPGCSLFGSYTGNGSTDGPFVWCGFRPRWVLVKRVDSTGAWVVNDTARDTFNVVDDLLNANTAGAETTFAALDVTANGFKLRNTDSGYNASGGTYVFGSMAENPFKFANAR